MTTDTTPAAIEALPREIARDIISGLMHAASYRSDRLQQTAAIDAAIAFISTVPALAAERDAARQERDAGAKDYCALMERHDAEFVRAEKAETEAADLRKEVERLRHIVTEQGQTMAQRLSRAEASELREAALRDALGLLSDHFQHGHLWSGETRGDTITKVERFARAALTSKGATE